MKTAEQVLVIVWIVFALAVVVWACHRDAPALLRHYAETGGDDLQEPPGPHVR